MNPNLEYEVSEMLRPFAPMTAEETRRLAFEQHINPRLRAAGVPEEHRNEAPLIPKQAQVFDALKEKLKSRGATVALVGIRGTGKTTLAAQVIREILWRDHQSVFEKYDGKRADVLWRTCFYHKMSAIVGRLKPLYGDFGTIEGPKLEAFRDRLSTCDLLVIDELAEMTTDQKFKDGILTDIVDRRYASLRNTILISNESPEAFTKGTNESIISRLNQRGGILPCIWQSFR